MKIIRNLTLHFQGFLLNKKDFIEDNLIKMYKMEKFLKAMGN